MAGAGGGRLEGGLRWAPYRSVVEFRSGLHRCANVGNISNRRTTESLRLAWRGRCRLRAASSQRPRPWHEGQRSGRSSDGSSLTLQRQAIASTAVESLIPTRCLSLPGQRAHRMGGSRGADYARARVKDVAQVPRPMRLLGCGVNWRWAVIQAKSGVKKLCSSLIGVSAYRLRPVHLSDLNSIATALSLSRV